MIAIVIVGIVLVAGIVVLVARGHADIEQRIDHLESFVRVRGAETVPIDRHFQQVWDRLCVLEGALEIPTRLSGGPSARLDRIESRIAPERAACHCDPFTKPAGVECCNVRISSVVVPCTDPDRWVNEVCERLAKKADGG